MRTRPLVVVGIGRRGVVELPAVTSIITLANGIPTSPAFTTAFFHLPDELFAEAADAGLHDVGVVAVKGPAWLLPDLDRWLSDDREVLLRTIRRVESTPHLLGASPHLLLTGQAKS